MIHKGDITQLHGWELEPVDCIVGGSPCQDLSVAGKRAGLDGARSGLFMEQMRLIREMRENDRAIGFTDAGCRPRWGVWENVPGAFSSKNGEDFAAVLEEFIKTAEPEATDVHVSVPKGGWPYSGIIRADDGHWSIAYRVHDAQFWGVPQRRRRISLVADFGGDRAAEVLFEPSSMCGDISSCIEAGQGPAGGTEESSSAKAGRRSDGAVNLLIEEDPLFA